MIVTVPLVRMAACCRSDQREVVQGHSQLHASSTTDPGKLAVVIAQRVTQEGYCVIGAAGVAASQVAVQVSQLSRHSFIHSSITVPHNNGF